MKIEIEVPNDLIRDTLTSAFEGGSNYWYHIYEQSGRADGTDYPNHPAYVAMAGGEVKIEHTDGDGEYLREPIDDAKFFRSLTIGSIRDGIALMAEKYGTHFGNMIGDNGDAITGDVLLQMCIFGDIIYG